MNMNEFSLTFDEEAMRTDLILELAKGIDRVMTNVLDEMKSGATSGFSVSWVKQVAQDVGTKKIRAVVGNNSWNAFLDNYGTGSKMTTKNPWLQDYVRSEYFNRERLVHNMAVVTREKKIYATHEYGKNVSNADIYKFGSGIRDKDGNAVNMETNKVGKAPLFKAQRAKFWFDNAFAKIDKYLDLELGDVFEHFDFSNDKYLKGVS